MLHRGEAEKKLGRFADGGNYILIDGSLVRILSRAELHRDGLIDGDVLHIESCVGRCRSEIEMRSFQRFESDVLASPGNIQSILWLELKWFAVDRDYAISRSDIDDAELASLKKRFAFRRLRFGLSGKRDWLLRRGDSADGEPFVVKVI